MMVIDPLVSYVFCGAGSLVAAAMMVCVQPDEARLRQALHLSTLAFVLLGLGMVHFLFTGSDPPPLTVWFTQQMAFAAVPIFALAMARLTGQAAIHRGMVTALLAVGTPAIAAAALVGGQATVITFALGATAGSGLLLVSLWPFVVRPRHLVERLLGLSTAIYLLSWLLRLGFALAYEGPPLVHQLYVPAVLEPWFAILYGTLPIVMASMVLNTISARLHQQLKSRASTDELTGVLMRRALRELAPAAVTRAQAAGRELALLMIDLDRFKSVNDEHGHLAGDQVLRHTADVLRTQLRPDALLGRFGGEEFMVLAEVNDVAAARGIAERRRLAVAHSPCSISSSERIEVTVSIGVAMLGPAEGLDSALLRSDEALYRAKRAGRDRVEVGMVAAV